MGLMDKLKGQAEQAASKAQQGAAQAQARFDAMQAKRAADGLLHDLGGAYYAEQRQGGPHDAVERALAALDAHASKGGPIDVSGAGPQTAPAQPPAPGGEPAAGDFKLDDM